MVYKVMTRLMPFYLLLLAMTCLCGSAMAQESDEPNAREVISEGMKKNPSRHFISISHENDLLGGDSDQFYTSGVRMSYFNAKTQVPFFLKQLDDYIPTLEFNETTSTHYSIGQNIYTPQDITVRANQNGDRPWAAFLYSSVGITTISDNHVDDLEVTLGVVGPEALGEQAQKFIHRHISDSDIPKGWHNQLKFEPGLIFSWQRRWPYAYSADFAGLKFRAEPNMNISLGNIYTYTGTGLMLTLGPGGDLQDTPPRVRPAIPGTGYFTTPNNGWSWHLFAGADGRAIARNIFLDGNTFTDSENIEKEHFVGDLTGGLAFTLSNYRLSYSINYRTDEFKGQNDDSVFGAVTLTAKF